MDDIVRALQDGDLHLALDRAEERARVLAPREAARFSGEIGVALRRHGFHRPAWKFFLKYLNSGEEDARILLHFGLLRRELGDASGAASAFARVEALLAAKPDPALAAELASAKSDTKTGKAEASPERRWRLLEGIVRSLNSDLASDKILEKIIDGAIEITGAERGFLMLEEEGRLAVRVARHMDGASSRTRVSQTIARTVFEAREPMLLDDASRDPRFRGAESVEAEQLLSTLCVPLRIRDRVVGTIYVDDRQRRGAFSARDAEVAALLADHAAMALEQARLTAELREANRRLEERLRGETERRARVERDLRAAVEIQPLRHGYPSILGRGPEMQAVLRMIDRAADADLPVLIHGESGTGKELVARALHDNGPRRAAKFVAVNCAAIPESLLESELFGHVKGSFTGADRDRDGLFVEAHGGTLFLDEIGEMNVAMQVKLLRVLQEREVRAVGASASRKIDVRLLCATNRDLTARVREGKFREDLYYRVAVIRIELPPLRERPEDLPALCEHFLQGKHLSAAAGERLLRHAWPGNVRELRNVLEGAAVLAPGPVIGPEHLQLPETPGDLTGPLEPLDRLVDRLTRQHILRVLDRVAWNRGEAGRILGIDRSTLYRLMKKHSIEEA